MAEPLGIIAGGGPLPRRVADAARAAGRPVAVVVLEGHGDPGAWAGYPHVVLRFGLAARMLSWLKGQGVRQLVLSGSVTRPSFLSLRPDAESVRLAVRIGRRAFGGDDELLSTVLAVLREEGFEPIGAQEVLAGLLAPPGLLTRAAPDAEAMADIARGVRVVRALGAVDVGQGAVVQQGLVLAVEAIEGTDAMLARAAGLRREGPGGVFVKLVKPGQDRRVDLPTLGPPTVAGAAAAGLRGIAFEAEGCILAERDAMIAAADAAGLFLLGLTPRQIGEMA
ncbi:MAG: UDP-2,3-diacylglucosamine diphosphatase LpxI [Acetobacteraceae bacterium]|nr:UDP-2,3-diacylglucosamine diphosphatase LpxI [Acetobacteraceae bacterium]MCX7683703.1 UDP-2,3-diacylglucosamine diphosphatase LpxI [Acetobacteraceae bacterium]MDW8398835.1 UDP-2,3-diacylglucosamine diphosphatase LpxI [Acetobacteraceae bacterium]